MYPWFVIVQFFSKPLQIDEIDIEHGCYVSQHFYKNVTLTHFNNILQFFFRKVKLLAEAILVFNVFIPFSASQVVVHYVMDAFIKE